MKAAVVKAPQAELGFEDRKRPTPGPGEVLIRVRACGVCHGDLMQQQGGFPFARFPVVPGHEVAGEVVELGDGVSWLKPGTRVGLSALYSAGGQCKRCIAGDEILCARGWEFTGITKDGGYQEFMIAPATYVAPLPEALDFSEAAPLMCRIMGSPAGSRRELRETLDFAAAHGIRPRITRLPLRKAGEALEQMHQGVLRGRAVLMMD